MRTFFSRLHAEAFRKLRMEGCSACLVGLGVAAALPAFAQNNDNAYLANTRWQSRAIYHAQKMRDYRDQDHGAQPTPATIPRFSVDFDPSGRIATLQPAGPTQTAQNAFFKDLGTNGRTCLTCHQPQNDWSVSVENIQSRFYSSSGSDPLFRLVDGAVCPTADVSTMDAKLQAYSLLLNKGLIRVALPIPANAEFRISSIDDPYGCNTNSATGLTSPTSGIVSVYRRPLSATNLGVLATIMWDGREPSLASQAADATLGHAQANSAPTPAQLADIVNFESGLFTAQIYDRKARELTPAGATGGPGILPQITRDFYIGINDSLNLNPKNIPFTNQIFDIYKSWENLQPASEAMPARASVARGEQLFNNTPIKISGVGGLNDLTGQPNIAGFCGTCHDTPNVGNLSVNFLLNIGVTDAPAQSVPALDVRGLPVFTIQCVAGPLAGATYNVTDPGRGLISGKCEDIGKFKGPALRGLAARAPYFHNGSAATLADVVLFYNQRFNLGLTDQERNDLVNFLQTL